MLVDSWLIKQHGQKFRPKWLGPYVIHQAYDNGTYVLSYLDGRIMKKRYNGQKLKNYHISDIQL